MDAISDDLLKPLGVGRSDAGARSRRPGAFILAGALALACAGFLIAAVDSQTGEPRAVAPIVRVTETPAPPSAVPAAAVAPMPSAAAEETRRSAAEVETASGVAVVRPDGAGAPGALVIRVPDAAATALTPAPDPRLTERTRHGLLPRIGADGARPSAVYARPAGTTLPGGARPAARIALLVGGLGLNGPATRDAIARLPAPVTLAFAPYGADLDRLAAEARAGGHEIMLQVPMEPFDYPASNPGPHTLTAGAKPPENLDRLHWAMSRFTGYTGAVNHMGARLTAEEAALAPILRELGGRGLAFLDDGSSPRSLSAAVGAAVRTPAARADLVLDGAARADAIDRELGRLEALARERGFAVGSASALPLTVERIAAWSRALEERGILLVPVSAAFGRGDRADGRESRR